MARFPAEHVSFAEQHVWSALAGMLSGATPLFTALVGATLTRVMPPRRVALGLAIGFGGTMVIAWPDLRNGSAGGQTRHPDDSVCVRVVRLRVHARGTAAET